MDAKERAVKDAVVEILAMEPQKRRQPRICREAYQVVDSAIKMAASLPTAKRVVVLYDRGITDSAAYLNPKAFQKMLREHHTSPREVASRYDGVVHLTTIAFGQEDVYKAINAGNTVRRETPQQAKL